MTVEAFAEFTAPVATKWATIPAATKNLLLENVKIRAHDLSHGLASMLVSGGRSLYEVQQILGQSGANHGPPTARPFTHTAVDVLDMWVTPFAKGFKSRTRPVLCIANKQYRL